MRQASKFANTVFGSIVDRNAGILDNNSIGLGGKSEKKVIAFSRASTGVHERMRRIVESVQNLGVKLR